MSLPSYFNGYKSDPIGRLCRGNQQSTYELMCRVKRELNKTDEWIVKTYNIVRNNPVKYGTYANNNAWSPIFTDDQLKAFISLMNE